MAECGRSAVLKYIIDEAQLTAIADATREATGSSDTYTVDEMPDAIKGAGGLQKITWPSTVTASNFAIPIIRNTLGIQGKVKIILADDIIPSTYESMIMWLDEDNAGVAEMHNRGWGTFGPNNVNQTRFYIGHHYYVMPVDVVPAKPTVTAMMNSGLQMDYGLQMDSGLQLDNFSDDLQMGEDNLLPEDVVLNDNKGSL